MAESDQSIRDIVAQLNGYPTDADVAASAAPVAVMPAPEVTPAMSYAAPQSAPAAAPGPPLVIAPAPTAVPGPPLDITPQAAPSTVPGPGGYSAADRFNKFSLPAGGGPLSVADAQKVIDSYESTGGHAFAPPDPSAPTRSKGSDWTIPVPTMTPPPVTPVPFGPSMGMLVAPRPPTPTMGTVLGVNRR